MSYTEILRKVLGLAAVLILLLSNLSAASNNAPQSGGWAPLGLSGGGAMFTPAISPADSQVMMVNCDMSAAYISEDGGRNWRMIHHAQLRTDIRTRPAFHPTDPNTVFASAGGQLRVSRDRGHTFTPIGNLKDSLQGAIAIHPLRPQVMLAGTRNGRCHVSRDAGVTWTSCAGPQGQVLAFFLSRAGEGRSMFAATDQGIWRSDDDGASWTPKTNGLPAQPVQGFAGAAQVSGKTMLYCTVRSTLVEGTLHGGIYRSLDRGETWIRAMGQGLNTDTASADQWSQGPVAQYEQLLCADANPDIVYAFNTSTGFHPPHHDTVFRSDDGGLTWRDVYFQDPRFQRYNVAPDYVTASAKKSLKGGGTPFGVAICNTDPNRVILVRNECHVTHDGGARWFAGHTYPAPGQTPGPNSAWICNGLVVTTTWNYYIDPFETNRHYIAYTDIGFARSLDAGKSWIWWDPKAQAPWRNTCYELAFDPQIPGKIWGAFSDVHDIPNDNIISERHGHDRPGGVCVSRDFAASWKNEARGLPPRPVTSIVIDPASPVQKRTLYAGVFMEGVFESTDDGSTWSLRNTGLGHPQNRRVCRVVLHADETLFALVCARRPARGQPLVPEGVGLYRSTDRARSWHLVNASLPLLYPKDYDVHPRDSRRILVGASDANGQKTGGLYYTSDGGLSWKRIGRQGHQTFGGYWHPREEGWIYMTLTEGNPGPGLWLSRDLGATWEAFGKLPFSNVQRVRITPDALFVTTFGGSVWKGPLAP